MNVDKPREIPKKTHWLVLLTAGILAVADLVALCFGLAMLFIALGEASHRSVAGPFIVVIYGGIVGSPVLGVLLVATILIVVLAKRLARTCRVVLLLLIVAAVVADAIAVASVFHVPKFGSIEIPAAKKYCQDAMVVPEIAANMLIVPRLRNKGDKPILHVTHDADDGMWQFLDGTTVSEENASIVRLEEITRIDPTVMDLADLPLGWYADRSAASEPWRRDI